MTLQEMAPIVQNVPDPRDSRRSKKFHKLSDILMMALGAALCGHRDFVAMHDFCMARAEVFRELFGIERIPSHDTFNRVFKLIDPASFEAICRQATHCLPLPGLGVVALDGKQPKGAELLAVSAWSSAGRVCLGTQCAESEKGKGSESPAMLAIVKALRLEGAVVTADAMGTSSQMATAVKNKKGDYVLALKDNQKLSHEWAKDWFAHAKPEAAWRGLDKAGGAAVTRELFVLAEPGQASRGDAFRFEGCKTACLMRKTISKRGAQDAVEDRCFVSSLSDPERIAESIRSHWSVENGLHWMLDVRFGEACCVGADLNAAKNLNLLRKMAIAALKDQGGENMKRTMNQLNLTPGKFKKAMGALAGTHRAA